MFASRGKDPVLLHESATTPPTSAQMRERWLISYADFITLLFCFFVVLYALSRTTLEGSSQFTPGAATAFSKLSIPSQLLLHPSRITPPDGSEQPTLDDVRSQLTRAFHRELSDGALALSSRSDGLVLSLREAGFYESGSAAPRPSSLPTLLRIAQSAKASRCDLRIEGHTDAVPVHNERFASNWELSTARAAALVRFFIEDAGIDPARLAAAGYAGQHPIASNATGSGRAQNRRVDVVFLARPLVIASAAPMDKWRKP